MPHHRRRGAPAEEAPSPRPSAAGCYAFLRSAPSSRRAGGYRRLDSAPAPKGADSAAVRVEVGTTRERAKSVFHVDPAVLEAGPVRRLLAAAGRRLAGGAVAVAVDVLLFEHLLWLATTAGNEEVGCDDPSGDLSEIVEFYSQDDDNDHLGF
ncbi:uncharacterized protein LOC133890539 [Phragmites australis]|uniref:uncharacterized protein LOC133890539 n=1 Tax=Phragmites australis TaxID=29695 RepID=UPI002D7A39D1|nr:uncharacterized protein LOC133890539 [Phragmites australis]